MGWEKGRRSLISGKSSQKYEAIKVGPSGLGARRMLQTEAQDDGEPERECQ